MMLLPAIKTLITDLNQTNVKLSQYQNFQLWIINLKEKEDIITLELLTSNNSDDSDYQVVNAIDIASDDHDTLTWCYAILDLTKQQTITKEAFWSKVTEQQQKLYVLEESSGIYVLTKKGVNFFKDTTIEEELNYYNYNILTILISLRKINDAPNLEPRKDHGQINFIGENKKNLIIMKTTSYKLMLIEGCLVYQCEVDWTAQKGNYLIKTNATIYDQTNFVMTNNEKMLSQLFDLTRLMNMVNERTLEYYRTLLLLKHQQQLFVYDKQSDCWTLTILGQKLFYQIDYPKFVINPNMMKFKLEKGI
ncbi:MAG: hypothetical protein EIB84_05780 [Spiroplasma poulsonii]|nr:MULTISPECIES: hypothetical protein [Spiroplasma]MBW1242284.1 hypothetical protein [Spiroplasma poulsonii]UNF61863.1 hypothetical protein MNU24_08095 [Spiroplasma poulsonii]